MKASGQLAGVPANFAALYYTRLSPEPPYYPTSEEEQESRIRRLLEVLGELVLMLTKEEWEATL